MASYRILVWEDKLILDGLNFTSCAAINIKATPMIMALSDTGQCPLARCPVDQRYSIVKL